MSADPGLRVGTGFDVHPFADGRALVLGGVAIAHERGLAGHSDADVLAHAICDALLGAAALGDIGRHFPDSDPAFRGISSLELLRRTAALLAAAGWSPLQVDTCILAEAPRIAPHAAGDARGDRRRPRHPRDNVGIKATTTEGLGSSGGARASPPRRSA